MSAHHLVVWVWHGACSRKQRLAQVYQHVALLRSSSSYLAGLLFLLSCRRMRDDLQQMRDKSVELELKMDRVRLPAPAPPPAEAAAEAAGLPPQVAGVAWL
jgi:hypothetical protein